MSPQTNERAFETQVEETLLGPGDWQSGTNAEWDVERALFPDRICHFLETTQPKLWSEMRTLHAAGLETLVIGALVKELDLKGALHVLRHGFKFYGKTSGLRISSPRTASTTKSSPSTPGTSSRSRARCCAIRASTTRWIWYSR